MAVNQDQVVVGTTPTLLSGAPGDAVSGSRIQVRNSSGTTSVFLGGPSVTTANGYELPAGASVAITLNEGESLHAVVVVGTVTVHALRAGM